ncbi:MAG: patatin-like phospholipase family protein, partial [Deltaproteobacteria bacterium]|nr:patatin-like phospholipase family protein [Kofleriaceae bacterium]
YQIGVLEHLVTHVAPELDRGLELEVLSGTSAGAIHAAAMASRIDDLGAAVTTMRDAWTSLRLDAMLRPSAIELLSMLSELAGRPERLHRILHALGARGGLVDPRPVARLCELAVDQGAIGEHLRRRRLTGVAVSATEVATGRATVFHQARHPPATGGAVMTPVELSPEHVLASASMPVLFPAVAIGGELYCDGGLRQMVPLSPALHLGARRVLMVSAVARIDDDVVAGAARRAAISSPLYLAGKALDALFSDGVESDLDRLMQVNRLLDAGARRYGPGFAASLDRELASAGAPPIRPIDVVHIQPSRDLGALAAAYVASEAFARGARGATSRVFRCVAGDNDARGGGLLAYLLFDGGFAAQLIELGRDDARARHDALVTLFAPGEAQARSMQPG